MQFEANTHAQRAPSKHEKKDLLFFRRGVRRELSSGRAFLWLALNLLVMLIGWSAIFVGATRLVARGE
jgi:uncharacterized membrane protein